jgi:hypothetical protein
MKLVYLSSSGDFEALQQHVYSHLLYLNMHKLFNIKYQYLALASAVFLESQSLET